jgi:multidrug efflux pump subunit AcrA (membrane-fusion protein)
MNIQQTIGIFSACLIFSACGQKPTPVRPERKDLTEMVFASGVLEADDQNNLTAQTDGYLIKLDFKEGDQVNAGQLLAVIDNSQNIINAQSAGALHNIARENTLPSAPALQQISANITAAKEKLRLDQLQANRYKRLMESNSVSKLEYENTQLTLATSQANLKALEDQYNTQLVAARQQEVTQRSMSEVNRVIREQNQIKAVISGQIYEKKKQLGDYVRKGDVIAVIANPQLIYARLNVDETNMAKVKVGEEAAIQLNTNKGRIYKGIVHEILPSFESTSQSFIVKAYFTDSLDFRITGTQLEANIIVGEKKNALVIPRSFLSYGNKVTIKGKGPVVIQTGIISNDWVEVTGGLTENEELVPEKK